MPTLHTERGDLLLSEGELALYRALDRDRFRVFTREELSRELGCTQRQLDAHAIGLRRQFDKLGLKMVANIWGVGYRLEANAP